MIKTVVFDFADTIAKLAPSKETIVQKFIKERLSIDIPLEKIAQTYFYLQNVYFYSSVKITDISRKKEFYRDYNMRVFSNLGVLHLMEDYLDDFFDYFTKNKKHWIIKPEALEVFNYLQTKNIHIGLISNFDIVLHDLLDTHLKIKPYFAYLHVSQEVGYEKPDQRFYESFLQTYSLDPKETLYIGDSYELDFLPSQKLGFQSVLLDEDNHYESIKDFPKISSLIDVISILEGEKMS